MINQTLKTKLNKINQKKKQLDDTRRRLIDEVTGKCPHKYALELPYELGLLGTEPPWLICLNCGLTEQGWGCGYKKLAKSQPCGTINHNDWLVQRTKSIFQGGHTVY